MPLSPSFFSGTIYSILFNAFLIPRWSCTIFYRKNVQKLISCLLQKIDKKKETFSIAWVQSFLQNYLQYFLQILLHLTLEHWSNFLSAIFHLTSIKYASIFFENQTSIFSTFSYNYKRKTFSACKIMSLTRALLQNK